jgi:hypothetical protein
MGLFDFLFGRTSGPAKKLVARFKEKSRAPTDPDLLKIAKDRKGHISRKAVHAEYNRLTEGWCRDVTVDVVDEVRQRIVEQDIVSEALLACLDVNRR